MFPAARIGDPITHDMLVPCGVIGPQAPAPCPLCAAAPVLIESLPAAHMMCTCVCSGAVTGGIVHPPIPGPQPPIVIGSPTVLIHNMPAARWAPSMDVSGCGVFLGDMKLTPMRTVLIGNVGMGRVGSTLGGAGLGQKQAHKQAACYQCRKQIIEAGEMSQDPKVQQAAARLKRLIHDIEHAKLSDSVYPERGVDAPPGWTNISNNSAELAKYGLTPKMLHDPDDSKFRAQMYVPDPAVFGDDMKPTVAFKGTTSGEDWKNNLMQGLGIKIRLLRRAVGIGNQLGDVGADVEMTGHSLGGGMASAAAGASGSNATTFNAAGLHDSTIKKCEGTPHESQINAYRVQGEILTGIQEQSVGGDVVAGVLGAAVFPVGAVTGVVAKRILSALLPDAKGTPIELPGHGLNPIDRHGMNQVLPSMEHQAAADQFVLEQATGQTCDCY